MSESTVQIFFYALMLLLAFGFNSGVAEAGMKCIEKERQALLMFKQGLVDDCGYLSSWGSDEGRKDCCKWSGVQCSNRTGHVIMLNLKYKVDPVCPNRPLRGNINSSLLELQHLHYLDLSVNDFLGNPIPEFIGSFTKLRFLDLSLANFSGRIPYQLGNLTNLQSLNLGYNSLYVSKFGWLSHLNKLTQLDLDFVDLSEASDWLQVITSLASLRDLYLASSTLPSINRPSLSSMNSSTSLALLDLSSCGLSNSAYHWLFKISSNLLALDLNSNQLAGPIPDYAFSNMTALQHLNLSLNQISAISKSFGNMCGLKTLHLFYNNLTGQLPELFLNLSGCSKNSLEILKLGGNKLTGSLPDITEFSSLQELHLFDNKLDGSFPEKFRKPSPLVILNLDGNQLWGSLPDLSVFPFLTRLDVSDSRLNGTVSEGLGRLSKLEFLDLFGNSLEGMITESHVSNLSKLKYMDFSFNSLALNFSFGWFPPFQLEYIGLLNCKLGPHFPKWLQSQKNYYFLDISDTEISDAVPSWFWDLSPNLYYLNLSHNHLEGTVLDLSLNYAGYPGIDLSSNDFEGPVPPVPGNVTSLNLSNNKFSGPISSLCSISGEYFSYLDVSDNLLSGELPDCLLRWQALAVLNLANNNFSGNFLNFVGSACPLESFNVRNNSFVGEIPPSLKKCNELKIIDAGDNKFSGTIPAWIGDTLPKLAILSLRSNQFHGSIPRNLCQLSKIQLLDFSLNSISGAIPKCINNLTEMVEKASSNSTITHIYVYYRSATLDGFVSKYDDVAVIVWKGTDQQYKKTLGLVKSIDLSSNKLHGEIPEEITSLGGLISLNLSRNALTGPIASKIGQLNLLDSLDLSNNQLTGEIPESLSLLNYLGVLDLSNNNLSGKIPSSNKLQGFDASAYAGNLELCGSPLPVKCPEDEPAQSPAITMQHSEDGIVSTGFYVSVALGFIVGFWGFVSSLLLNRSWRRAYWQFLDHTKERLCTNTVPNAAKRQR